MGILPVMHVIQCPEKMPDPVQLDTDVFFTRQYVYDTRQMQCSDTLHSVNVPVVPEHHPVPACLYPVNDLVPCQVVFRIELFPVDDLVK